MTDIIHFAKTKTNLEVECLLKIIQPAIDDIGKMVSCQLQPFIQSVVMCEYALDILYAPVRTLIEELKVFREDNNGFSKLDEEQIRSYRNFLECFDQQQGTLLLYWLHEGDCYQFHFIHTAESNYTLFGVWVNDLNLFETALDQTAEYFKVPRRQLINNPFNRKPFKVSNDDTVIME